MCPHVPWTLYQYRISSVNRANILNCAIIMACTGIATLLKLYGIMQQQVGTCVSWESVFLSLLCSFLAVLSCIYITAVVTAKYFLVEKYPSELSCTNSWRNIESWVPTLMSSYLPTQLSSWYFHFNTHTLINFGNFWGEFSIIPAWGYVCFE